MTWLNFLKDYAEINKMLNASIQSLSTIHYSLSHAPAPYDDTDHTGETGLFQASGQWSVSGAGKRLMTWLNF